MTEWIIPSGNIFGFEENKPKKVDKKKKDTQKKHDFNHEKTAASSNVSPISHSSDIISDELLARFIDRSTSVEEDKVVIEQLGQSYELLDAYLTIETTVKFVDQEPINAPDLERAKKQIVQELQTVREQQTTQETTDGQNLSKEIYHFVAASKIQDIQQTRQEKKKSKKGFSIFGKRFYLAAAAIAVVIVASTLFVLIHTNPSQNGLAYEKRKSDKPQQVSSQQETQSEQTYIAQKGEPGNGSQMSSSQNIDIKSSESNTDAAISDQNLDVDYYDDDIIFGFPNIDSEQTYIAQTGEMVKNVRKGHSVDEDVMPVFPHNISYDFDPENVFYQDLGEVEIPEYVNDEEVYAVCEYDDPPVQFAHKQPEFPGGPEALQKFLRSETQYPQVAKDAHAQGTVIVQFVVERDGCVSNIKILSPVFPALDQEAIRVCKSMPKWIPGENNDGKKVRVYYRMPLQFSLD